MFAFNRAVSLHKNLLQYASDCTPKKLGRIAPFPFYITADDNETDSLFTHPGLVPLQYYTSVCLETSFKRKKKDTRFVQKKTWMTFICVCVMASSTSIGNPCPLTTEESFSILRWTGGADKV